MTLTRRFVAGTVLVLAFLAGMTSSAEGRTCGPQAKLLDGGRWHDGRFCTPGGTAPGSTVGTTPGTEPEPVTDPPEAHETPAAEPVYASPRFTG